MRKHSKDPKNGVKPLGPEERRRAVARWSQRMYQELQEFLPKVSNEADFRRAFERLLDEFCAEIGLSPSVRSEYTLARGRADAVFNRFVIEYERPGKLKDPPDKATRHAVQQVKDYLDGLAKKERHLPDRLAGVAFDGHYIVFVRRIREHWSEEGPFPADPSSLERFLTWLAGLASGIALTPENLSRDFSLSEPRTQHILRGLYDALNAALTDQNGLVFKLFQQWRLFFSEAIDYYEAFGGRKLEPIKEWVQRAGFAIESAEEAERFFFALHTYFALLAKLLAWMALSHHMAVRLGAPSFAALATKEGEALRRDLENMESGGIFRAYGILNLLEGDFFSWYLHAWNDDLEEAIREILKRLDEYDPTTLSVTPEETRDLFKGLYHYLLPREVRHNLGEYYTPDWLAQWVLSRVDRDFFTGDPRRNEVASPSGEHREEMRQQVLSLRFLDPACGSGTFLVLIIARMLEVARALFIPEEEILESILSNVVGFDLNPLAVLTARVNYLLAIADLLKHRQKEISLPVYLADSVLTPAVGGALFSYDAYEFPTAVGKFLIPASLCKPGRFDRFCDLLEDSIGEDLSPDAFLHQVEKELEPPKWDDPAINRTRELYKELQDLHHKGLNGIWARILKNNFAPLTVGQFDFVVGNPPWINWEHLPDGYRDSTIGLWARYELAGTFSGGRPRLGAVKVDISALMTYVVTDKLLKTEGKLGFIITQSVLKTAAGRGFRRFKLPGSEGAPLRVLHVDDMVDLNPFEGASNRTAVIVLEKGKPTQYPVPYTVWRKKKGARFTYDSTLEEVIQATKRLEFVAEPVDLRDPTSPWLTARPKALRAIRKVLGPSGYSAHEGVNTGGANAVYWVEIVDKRPDSLVIVRNLTEGAKVKVEKVEHAVIEPDLLYPLLRGRDVKRWQAEPSAWIIVPQDPDQPSKAYPEERLQMDYPHTYGYLKRFEKVLRQRSGYVQILSKRNKQEKREEEFYGLMDINHYTFAPWKVVWPNIASSLNAAVVGQAENKPIVPQHIVTLVACEDEDEAHYICALINSSAANLAARTYAQEGGKSFGTPHILEHIRIPRFDPDNPLHQRLAELSKEAHQAVKETNKAKLREIEAEIDEKAAELWDLSDEELREIQESLRELSGAASAPSEN